MTRYALPLSIWMVLFALAGGLALSGCTDDMFSEPEIKNVRHDTAPTEAPVSDTYAKLRHPQMLDRARGGGLGAGKSASSAEIHLYVAFDEYEEDRITRRLLDKYRITRRILDKYDPDMIRLKVRLDHAGAGFTLAIDPSIFDQFMQDAQNDPDILFVEPDPSVQGEPLIHREGFRHQNQMVPWNIVRVGGVFTVFPNPNVRIYLLDSGVYDRDLEVVEKKDFTMLFQNRDQELLDDSLIIHMPVFDPGAGGDPVDHSGHGSHGAGTIAARNNDEGVRGMAPGARIHSLKVLTDDGRTDLTTVMAAVDYVTDQKQRYPLIPMVINLSLGADIGTTAYNALDDVIQKAVEYGVVVVVSAGNDGQDASTYSPAHVAEAITVGAYGQGDDFADFSNYGPVVDLLAPGDAVVSLTHLEQEARNDENVLLSGTSTAAPHVAAAAALYLSQHPDATPAQVKQALINYAVPGIKGAPSNTTDRSVFVGVFAGDGEDKPFAFQKAAWDSDKGKLTFEGVGPRLSLVALTSEATGEEIARPTVDESGKWKVEFINPYRIPCAVVATHNGTSTRREVSGAPDDCDRPLALTKAKWDAGKAKLEVEGTGPKEYEVVLTDADTGDRIATVTATSRGQFKFREEGFPFAPCSVHAELVTAAVQPQVLPVENAPGDCSSGAGRTLEVGFVEASWDNYYKRLRLEGVGAPGTDVTLMSEASGTVLTTATIDKKGGFLAVLDYPALVPCTVMLDHAGTTAQTDVLAAPSDCERSLTLERVKWNEGGLEMEMKGRGVYHGTVTFANARTGAVFFTAAIDNKGRFDEKATPSVIPCAVIVASEGREPVTLQADVDNQPYYCDYELSVNTVNWVAAQTRLEVGGIATGGSIVSLFNADNGVEISTVTVDTERNWRFDLDLSASGGAPPCKVRVTSQNGGDIVRAVSAPNCNRNLIYTPPAEGRADQNPHSFVGINKAEWSSGPQRLYVEGDGYVFMAATISNTNTGAVYGITMVDRNEEWSFDTHFVNPVPCSVTATLDGRAATLAVRNAPLNCDGEPYLDFTKGEWDAGNRRLRLEGFGLSGSNTPNATVVFTNAATGAPVGTATTESNGNWRADLLNLTTVPCTVRAELEGATQDLPVVRAPLNCDGRSYVDLTKAEWDAGKRKLKLEGIGLSGAGAPGVTVTITSAATGAPVGTATTDAQGAWRVELSNLAQAPCTVRAELEGATDDMPVNKAPATCR